MNFGGFYWRPRDIIAAIFDLIILGGLAVLFVGSWIEAPSNPPLDHPQKMESRR